MEAIEAIKQASFVALPVASAIVCWQLKRLIDSVDKLNVRVAVVIEQVKHHEQRIARLEDKTD